MTICPTCGDEKPDIVRERLDDAVRAVGQFLVADVPLGETLRRIADLAVEALPPAAAVGVTMLDNKLRPITAVFTDELAPAIDQGQYEDGAGPCLTAFRESRVVRVDDTRTVIDRWPRFSDDALRQGVFSTLSLPLMAGDENFGAFNMYAREAGAFSEEDEDAASLFVTQGSVVLANARAYWEAFELAGGLRQALTTRAVIEQAKGKLMATEGCTDEAAFAIMVRASQRENVKLREIARRLVEGP